MFSIVFDLYSIDRYALIAGNLIRDADSMISRFYSIVLRFKAIIYSIVS